MTTCISDITKPVTATPTTLRLRLHSAAARAERRYMPGFVAFGFCVWARFGSGFRAKHSRQSAISFGGELGFRLWGNPAQPQDVFAHSVFWFLAPWVTLVQRIGGRHSGLGATIKCRATGI